MGLLHIPLQTKPITKKDTSPWLLSSFQRPYKPYTTMFNYFSFNWNNSK